MSILWSFNRIKDEQKIERLNVDWKGPYSWPKFEEVNDLPQMPDVEGVYLFSFTFKNGYLVTGVGVTNSTVKRIKQHNREFKKGNYTILNVESVKIGERKEIWHGWKYAKENQLEFNEKREAIYSSLNLYLSEMKLFIAEQSHKRLRERTEAAIVYGLYVSKQPWSEVIDRGMYLNGRYNSEMPILTINHFEKPIFGLPEELEI